MSTIRSVGNIPSIQYLRGLAAFMVVLFHSSREIRSQIGPATLAWGEFGVDIFFCISGFVMMHSVAASKQPPTFAGFMKNRLIRIAPLYWLMTALMVCAVQFRPEVFKSAVLNVDHVVLSFLFIPHFHPGIEMAVMPMLVPGWTLSYEMYFYIVFGMALALPEGFRLAGVGLVLACGNIAANLGVFGSSAAAPFLSNSMIYEFLLGMAISTSTSYRRALALPPHLAMIVAPIALGAVIVLSRLDYRFITAGVFSAVLLYATLSIPDRMNQGLRSFFAALGDSSYSLYLSHIFTIGVVGLVWRRLGTVQVADTLSSAIFYLFICALTSVLVGFAVYKIIEVPLTNWVRMRLR